MENYKKEIKTIENLIKILSDNIQKFQEPPGADKKNCLQILSSFKEISEKLEELKGTRAIFPAFGNKDIVKRSEIRIKTWINLLKNHRLDLFTELLDGNGKNVSSRIDEMVNLARLIITTYQFHLNSVEKDFTLLNSN